MHSLSAFIIDQFWFFTLPQRVMGRSDCQLSRLPHFSSNFKIFRILKFFHQFIKENHQFIKFIKFHKIFFLDLVPPSKKLQMQTQIQTKTEKMTRIFFIERWYKSYTWLTIGWHLADNCTSVTTWHFDILPMPEVFMQCEFLQVQWPSTF